MKTDKAALQSLIEAGPLFSAVKENVEATMMAKKKGRALKAKE